MIIMHGTNTNNEQLVKTMEDITGYTIEYIKNPVKYYKRVRQVFGELHELNYVGYPNLFITGWCSYDNNHIVIFSPFGSVRDKVLLHECGHALGHDHVPKFDRRYIGHIMHPFGVLRGMNGFDEVFGEHTHEIVKHW